MWSFLTKGTVQRDFHRGPTELWPSRLHFRTTKLWVAGGVITRVADKGRWDGGTLFTPDARFDVCACSMVCKSERKGGGSEARV